MRTFWPTLVLLIFCGTATAFGQRAPVQEPAPGRLEPREQPELGQRDNIAPPEGEGVTIGEPQIIGQPQEIGEPQVIGTPQSIGGSGNGGPDRGLNLPTDPDASTYDPPVDTWSGDQGVGGSPEPGLPEETARPEDEVFRDEGALPEDEAFREEGGTGGGPDAAVDPALPEDEAFLDDEGTGGSPPVDEAPTNVEQDVSPAGVETGTEEAPSDPAQAQLEEGTGGAGPVLQPPGLVLGTTDPQTGELLDPAEVAQAEPDGAPAPSEPPDGTQPPGPVAQAPVSPAQADPTGDAALDAQQQLSPEEQEEQDVADSIDALTEVNERSLELQDAQLEVLELQWARQEEQEARRIETEQREQLSLQQRTRAVGLIDEATLAARMGETDLSGSLSQVRALLLDASEEAQIDGLFEHSRALSEALGWLDAAELAAEAHNGLEASRWLLAARELLEGGAINLPPSQLMLPPDAADLP